jgi:hypothetical protein
MELIDHGEVGVGQRIEGLAGPRQGFEQRGLPCFRAL